MSKLPVPTAKEINEAHERAKSFAENAVGWAIKCGQMLARKKVELGHGKFGEWVETYCQFGDRQARRYMEAASKTDLRVRFASLQQLLDHDKPEPKSKPESLTGAKPAGAVESKPTPAPAAPPVSPPAAADDLTAAPSNEGAESATAAADQPEWTEADEAEYHAQEEINARARIEAAIAADDKLAEALEQIKQLSAELAVVKRSRDHYMNQAGEAVRLLKAEQRKVARLEKQLGKKAA